VTGLTAADVQDHIREYVSLLNNSSDERPIHRFLANHSYFFQCILRLNGQSPLYSKIKLGNEYEVDFACFDSGSVGPEWYLVEIESPTCTMFTKAGRPSAKLTHAIQQVSDWRSWVQENLHSARKLMPYIDHPLGYIFMGRRNDLDQPGQMLLRRIITENRLFFRIHSLDRLADCAKDVLGMTGKDGHASWSLPMKALTHKDLRRGLPADAQGYMNDFVPTLINIKRYPKEMLEDREHIDFDGRGF
jgi:antiviral defense system Shedu protein SduA